MSSSVKRLIADNPFGLSVIEAATIVPLSSGNPKKRTAETLSSLSAEALYKFHPEIIIDLGGARKGVRVIDALMAKLERRK